MSEQIKCKIEVQKEVFYNQESSYGIYGCEVVDMIQGKPKLHPKYGTISLVGVMPKLEQYKEYTVTCEETQNPKYGVQYNFCSMQITRPTSNKEQQDFILTLLTPLQVQEIVKVYSSPITAIIEGQFDYKQVKGIGKKTYEKIEKKILENFELFEVLSKLGQYGIDYATIKKLYSQFKNTELILKRIEEEPYETLMELDGFGFVRTDKIAKKMGIKDNDIRRISACVFYVLTQQEQYGHTWTYFDFIYDELKELCGSFNCDLKELIKENNRYVLVDDNKISLYRTYKAEKSIYKDVTRLQSHDVSFCYEVDDFLKKQQKDQGFKYADKQIKFFELVQKYPVVCLTGYAGCGKSTIIKGLHNLLDEIGFEYINLSPSAKAAKVLQRISGREAFTIHRGLAWTPDGFSYNREFPLEEDVIIVDESSMVDVFLASKLIEAVKDGGRIIFVGDIGQIESVGTGNLLSDLINSGKVPTIQLTEVFRQALDSGILQVATNIRSGINIIGYEEKKPQKYGIKEDMVIFPVVEEETQNITMGIYKKLLNKYPKEQIVVLSPTKKGEVGTFELNKELQNIINLKCSMKNDIEHGDKFKKHFRDDDLCIHIQNNYRAEWLDYMYDPINKFGVFNGDTGVILEVNKEDKDDILVYADYGDKIIEYSRSMLQQLDHAYSLTVHKSQGSSWPVVICVLDNKSSFMATRQLLYTAITRASELCVLICNPKTVWKAIKTDNVSEKRTFLKEMLNNSIDIR